MHFSSFANIFQIIFIVYKMHTEIQIYNFRISSWTPNLCGIRITNATIEDTGYWRLTSSVGSEMTRGVVKLIVQGLMV